MTARVCVVIPAWNGADVIADAIGCARAQTFADLDILVSVDACEDGTADVARKIAQTDSRVRVIEHAERVGWVRNVNAALDRVRSEFFFLYFHDDLIQPSFVEILLAQLEAAPQASAVYCNTIQDQGGAQREDGGRAYTGNGLVRMLDRLLLEQAGAPLRALTRRKALDAGLRFPVGSLYGFHAQHAYLLDLIGGGDCLYEPAAMYTRRNWRPGALTKSWRKQPVDVMAADLILTARRMHAIGDMRLQHNVERQQLRRAVGLRLAVAMRHLETSMPAAPLVNLEALFGGAGPEVVFHERWSGAASALEMRIATLEEKAARRRSAP